LKHAFENKLRQYKMKKILKNKTLPKKKNLRVEKEVGNCLFSHLHKKNVGKNY
jgi:hypothetical protein